MNLSAGVRQPLESVLAYIDAQTWAWIRLAAAKYDGLWSIEVADIVTGTTPPKWQSERLVYGEGIFLATKEKGSTVATWLRRGYLRRAGATLRLPTLNPNPLVERRPSNAVTVVAQRLEWPYYTTNLLNLSSQNQQPQGKLIAEGMPPFRDFATAARYLVGDSSAVSSTISQRISYRHQDTRVRISLVEYSDREVFVSVDGDHPAGVTVQLMSSRPTPGKKLRRRPVRPICFKLEEGIPHMTSAILLLKDEWLDEKSFAWDYQMDKDDSVRKIAPFSSKDRLETLLYYKETGTVEFKQGYPGESVDDKENVLKSVAAFANANGGSIFFGINSRYEAKGLDQDYVPKFQDDLSNLIDDWVIPQPKWEFDLVAIPGEASRLVVELIVHQGALPPYGIGTSRKSLRYFVRQGSRSVPARQDEVRTLARSRPDIVPGHASNYL